GNRVGFAHMDDDRVKGGQRRQDGDLPFREQVPRHVTAAAVYAGLQAASFPGGVVPVRRHEKPQAVLVEEVKAGDGPHTRLEDPVLQLQADRVGDVDPVHRPGVAAHADRLEPHQVVPRGGVEVVPAPLGGRAGPGSEVAAHYLASVSFVGDL